MGGIVAVVRKWFGRGATTPRLPIAGAVEPIPIGSDVDTVKQARTVVESATAQGATADDLIRGDAILKASVDLRVRRVLDAQEEPVACRKGCGHCCQVPVSTFAFEIFPIADHVRNTWTSREKRGLMRRLRAYRATVAKPGERHPWCPFLHEGSCSIYEVRPTICRTHHSSDLAACLKDLSVRPPSAQPFHYAVVPLYDGAFEALGARGGFPEGLEMALAVEIALREPKAMDCFLAGGDPFIAAYRNPRTSRLSSKRR
ncbi:YkgJ family cysteine cluster protein [bacterium]|nr:MAG: YkgJ family cysteine cluster protein [bacterium]